MAQPTQQPSASAPEIDAGTILLVRRRIVWLLFFLFLFQALDRTNVSYAALEMNRALGFSPSQFGFGVSITFLGMLLFQIPSVMLMHRIGAKAWFGLIVTLWGCSTLGLAFIANHDTFYLFRFLIGIFEAGFSPGLVYYLSRWLPDRERGGAMGLVLLSIPVSQIVGAPLSGFLLSTGDTLGLPGWRMLFLVEGLATIFLGIFAFFRLADGPMTATWLPFDARKKLADLNGVPSATPVQPEGAWTVFTSIIRTWQIWALACLWCCLSMGMFGLVFWLPQVVKEMSGGTTLSATLLSGLPWIGAAIAMVANGHGSDRSGKRTTAIMLPCALGAFGLALAAIAPGPIVGFVGLMCAGLGVAATHSVFWTIPPRLFPPARLSAAIVAINITGTISGFLVSNLIGWLQETTGDLRVALMFLSGVVTLAMIISALLRKHVDHGPNDRSKFSHS